MGALHSIRQLSRLRRRLTWPSERLDRLRCQKLRGLLEYCYREIPYYQEQFSKIGAQPADFKSVDDLVKFPILEKEILRDRREEIVNPEADLGSRIPYRSSGSTGIPLELYYHPSERLRMGFTVTRELLYNGLKPWHRMVNITEPRHSVPKDRWYHRLGFMNEQFLSVYDASDLNLEKLTAIQPQVLIGFPSVLLVIGEELFRSGTLPWRPQFLFTLAEVLTYDYRRRLKEQWGVEPVDLYGANEVGHIAFQCPQHNGYHINMDSVHVEIMNGERHVQFGQRGELIVTNFDLRVMPIIRYRVGDIAEATDETCVCGCTFPMLKNIHGRSDGFIMNRHGTVFSALEISLLLKPLEGVDQYRLVQECRDHLTVQWVSRSESDAPATQILKLLMERLGDDLEIEVQRVSSIPREKSGKIRSVVSVLESPFWNDKS